MFPHTGLWACAVSILKLCTLNSYPLAISLGCYGLLSIYSSQEEPYLCLMQPAAFTFSEGNLSRSKLFMLFLWIRFGLAPEKATTDEQRSEREQQPAPTPSQLSGQRDHFHTMWPENVDRILAGWGQLARKF